MTDQRTAAKAVRHERSGAQLSRCQLAQCFSDLARSSGSGCRRRRAAGAPPSSIRTFWRFGLKRRRVATIEWLREFPNAGFLPQL